MARKKYKGVFLDSSTGKYRAKHSKISLGYFDTAEAAARAKDLGLLAVETRASPKAGRLNFSREDYTDTQIEAMAQRINAPKNPPASPYRNVDPRGGRGFDARVRFGNTRVYLGFHKTAEKAAATVDLAKMLLQGGSPAAVDDLNLDWSAASEEELRSKQAPVLQTLLGKLHETPGQVAADCRKALLDMNVGLLQQQQEQEQEQEQLRQPSIQQEQQQLQTPAQQQQPPVQLQRQEQEQERQTPSQQQQQQQQMRSATEQEQRQPEAQQQAQQQQQQQEAAPRQAQAQGREPPIPQQEAALRQRVVLELPAEAVQQAVSGMQSMASGLQQLGSGMQHVGSGLQQLASSVQQMFSGMKRMAGAPPSDAAARRRRLQM